MLLLFHLPGDVVQCEVTFPALFSGLYCASQCGRLILMAFEQPQC